MKLWLYKISLGIDALMGVIAVISYIVGVVDGSVTVDNSGMWMGIFAALMAIIGGGVWLKNAGHMMLGTLLLLVLAIPSFISGLFLFLFAISDTQWR